VRTPNQVSHDPVWISCSQKNKTSTNHKSIKIKQHSDNLTNNNMQLLCFLLFLVLLFCCCHATTAELTEEIIVAKEEAWARRAIADYNRGYRLRGHQHPLTHHADIQYKVPMPSSHNDGKEFKKVLQDEQEESNESDSIDATTQDDDDKPLPLKFYLRGGARRASRPSS
jgi:hypothetical protein